MNFDFVREVLLLEVKKAERQLSIFNIKFATEREMLKRRITECQAARKILEQAQGIKTDD